VHLRVYFRLACLFLSGKVEEDFIKIEDLISKVYKKATVDGILQSEQKLLTVHLYQTFTSLDNYII